MTRRMQIRIIALFVLVILGFIGYVAYSKYNQPDPMTKESKFVKEVAFASSDKTAIFTVRWKDEMKTSTVRDPNNYLIEHVYPKGRKWLTAVNGKKCKINLIQHVPDKFDPDKKLKATQITVIVDPKEDVNDYFRLRVRNVETKSGQRMNSVEYGVVQVTNFAKLTKK